MSAPTPVEKFMDYLNNNEVAEAMALLNSHPELYAAKNQLGVSLLLVCAYYQQEALVTKILSHRQPADAFEAAAFGSLSLLKDILEKSPEALNAFSPDGFTCLGLASYFGQTEIVAFLVDKQADVNLASQNNMQVTPLHSAVANQNFDSALLLLKAGANVNAQQQQGVTALHSAAHRGDAPMVELLIENQADICAKMQNGKTPLDFAREDGYPEVEALLQAALDDC